MSEEKRRENFLKWLDSKLPIKGKFTILKFRIHENDLLKKQLLIKRVDMKKAVIIEWDKPTEKDWLCDENIRIALQSCCKNTEFKIKEIPIPEKPTDGELEIIVNKIAHDQTAENQADDFLNKMHYLKEFIENKYF